MADLRRECLAARQKFTRSKGGCSAVRGMDRGIPGDPPRSLYLLSSGRKIPRRPEKVEVGPAEEGQQTSRGCLIV